MSWEHLVSLGAAALLGGLVGLERELEGKAAGVRTNMLICIGAAIFTIISREMALNTSDGASDRIAAQVVGGIGFLGAGAIIRERSGIYGLTTAATMWLAASIGLACGAGYLVLAVVSTALTLIVLYALAPLTRSIRRRRAQKDQTQQKEPPQT